MKLVDITGTWEVDPTRHSSPHNAGGRMIVAPDRVELAGFDHQIINRVFADDVTIAPGPDGSIVASGEDFVRGEVVSARLFRDRDGVHVELSGMDVMPWWATFPVRRVRR